MSKAIITAAVTGGIHTPSMSPHLPLTPEQIADDAVGQPRPGPQSCMSMPGIPKAACLPPTKIISTDYQQHKKAIQCGHLHYHRRRNRADDRTTRGRRP